MVTDSGPKLSLEIRDLLKSRLRLAALTLFAGNLLFLAKHFRWKDFSIYFFGFHVFLTLTLGVIGVMLCRRCVISMRWLRILELIVFGLPAIFFLGMQRVVMIDCCENDYFHFPIGIWLILIFTYALFIPNTLRRAVIVISLLTIVPLAMGAITMYLHPKMFELASFTDMANFPLMLVIAAAASIFGVDTIGSLRREAFEARQLGQYRLTRSLGAGGMGEVYLAEHQLLKRPCVVKLIRHDKAGDSKALARFEREVQATAKLSHWNTVEIFDYGNTDDGTFYYVMEYLPGMSLYELVNRFGPMPAARVVHFLRQACNALGEAHAAGMVHRDIKPANIFAAQRGGVCDVTKLLDFGLVKPVVEEQSAELTAEGTITGSPLFMSPEQAIGDKPDVRSDIYSLGAVGYYLLTGHPPFEADRPIKILFAHANQPIIPPSQRREHVSPDLEQVILRCLAKAPSERFPDAATLEKALAGCESADQWTHSDAAAWWQQYAPLKSD